nr:hypothetical protein [Tanacetum cinerariifolium]
MSSQQDIYASGSENRPPMLNKDNYVPWSSRIIRYARSRPTGKTIVDSIENGPYVRRMIATLGEPSLLVPVPESLHEQTDEELTENDLNCETAKEIWERVRQLMKGSDIGEQEKKAKLFNEWEKFTSTDGESIESYYHPFMQLMNDLKRNKHLPENIASNLKFLNNLQPEWKRHEEVNELRAERLAKSHDPLASMAHSQNSFNFPTTHKDQSSSSTHSQQSFPINNKYNPQPSLNQNFMQPLMTSHKNINDPTEAMNAALILFAKAFQLTSPTNNNQRTSPNPRNRQIAQPVMNIGQDRQIQNVGGNGGNQFGQYAGQVAQNQQWVLEMGIKPGATTTEDWVILLGIALPDQEECDLDEIEKVNANCILMANLQHASTSGTQLDKAPVYDTDGSAEVHLKDNCYDYEIFNMFTQEEQYTDLLEHIPELQLVPQNDNHVNSVSPSMVQSGGTVEKSFAPNEETHSCETAKEIWERVRQLMKGSDIGEQKKKANLFNEWEKFTSTDGESIESYYHPFMKLMNDLKRNKHLPENIASNLKFLNNLQPEWKRHVTIVRQTKNLHEADFTQINDILKMNQEENGGNQNGIVVVQGIANQNRTGNVVATRAEGTGNRNQARLSYSLLKRKKQGFNFEQKNLTSWLLQLDKAPVYDTDGSAEVHLKDNCYDYEIFNMFTQEEQYTDLLEPIPEPQLVPQNDNHVNSVSPSMVQSGGTVEKSFAPNEETRAHSETVYRNLVDQVAQTMHRLNPKPDSFYHLNQNMALGYPNPSYLKKPQLKQQSVYNGNLLLKEHDPPAVYNSEETIELAQERVFVPQMTKSKEELFLSNISNMVTVSKMISIPNEDLSDDTNPNVARKIVSYEISPIINQVDARVKIFEIQFLQEAAKFVRDFKSLAKEADESTDNQKSLEFEIDRLLKASVSHDIMSIVQNGFVDVPSDL